MFSQYYHKLTRKYISVFGTIFNSIEIDRDDAEGNTVQTIAVPISYAPKESWYVRLEKDPNLDNQVAITLPRMGFQVTNFEYAPQRQKNSNIKNVYVNTATTNKSQFVPVPWDINFSLFVMTRHADDGTQIIEQILPFFRPEWTVSMNLIPEMDITMDIPYVLQSMVLEDTYEPGFDTRRVQIWTLDFICHAWFFGPVSNSGVIRKTIINFYPTIDADE